MKHILLLFKAALILLILCLSCFIFVTNGTPEFFATLIATVINVVVLIVCVILMLTHGKK